MVNNNFESLAASMDKILNSKEHMKLFNIDKRSMHSHDENCASDCSYNKDMDELVVEEDNKHDFGDESYSSEDDSGEEESMSLKEACSVLGLDEEECEMYNCDEDLLHMLEEAKEKCLEDEDCDHEKVHEAMSVVKNHFCESEECLEEDDMDDEEVSADKDYSLDGMAFNQTVTTLLKLSQYLESKGFVRSAGHSLNLVSSFLSEAKDKASKMKDKEKMMKDKNKAKDKMMKEKEKMAKEKEKEKLKKEKEKEKMKKDKEKEKTNKPKK